MIKRIRLPALGGILVSVGGLLSHPEILNLLPEKWALVASASGILIQAVTKALVRTPEEVEAKRYR
jgi:hypothetical protein